MTGRSPHEDSDPFFGLNLAQGLLCTSVFLGVEATIWGGLSFFIPNGWWHIGINVPFFIASIASAAVMLNWLETKINVKWLAWVVTLGIWYVAVIMWRSIFLGILDEIF